ncbi:MAG: aminoacyl-tRNA hydrolase [Kiritimatiellae bacterium]|nr:aminoacyl-tRNA hydrolase [Kiritimatiellia bacterium]
MKVVVGLGNPGAQYANTPHSVGFEVVDAVASACGAAWEEKRQFKCLMAKTLFAGTGVLLVKPQTYMNLSGDSVAPVVKYHNATAADLVVVQDDIDLAVGKLRIRRAGSCGGHNGVRSIIERLGTGDFTRLKIGVGKDRANVVGHVLGKFDPETRKTIDRVVEEAVKAVAAILRDGPERAMNSFNGSTVPAENAPRV